ncbi:hypothetical protein KXQ82_06395 [Mucilaginibacter sp. HMF5004]|uniref:hypothetical protein n=1 Tax=Mucilaginibacter rivuli TaxID=2857527 RepID=UPI001C5D64D8|nr:hypothetical protein [Mucilaginibacter rivuli]MBW4889336.1 hypothetical protein [Mucilaginibacter rivuli]
MSSAFAQLDFYYGKNTKGLRVGLGPGVTTLFTHYSSFPFGLTIVGDVDYAFNPYFSIGINGQSGKLIGQDNTGKFYYQTATDSYMAGSLNMKFGLGLITDFNSKNGFMDALKRLYIGLGYGQIKTDNKITINNDVSPTTVYDDPDNQNGKQFKGTFSFYAFNLGTYIDLPGVWGTDKLELCPNFQFNMTNTLYLDGYRSKPSSNLKGSYSATSLTLRYKF